MSWRDILKAKEKAISIKKMTAHINFYKFGYSSVKMNLAVEMLS